MQSYFTVRGVAGCQSFSQPFNFIIYAHIAAVLGTQRETPNCEHLLSAVPLGLMSQVNGCLYLMQTRIWVTVSNCTLTQ